MKTWLPMGACLLAAYMASDSYFVAGFDLEHLDNEQEMSLRGLYDSYEDSGEEDSRKRRQARYGGPRPSNGGIISPGFPQPPIGNPNPGFPQPPIGNPNTGFPQPPIGNPNPGFPRPPIIIGKVCKGVPRSSPHWVPGLDVWCPQNCPTGNCPSYLCVCY